jgi:hypothetical protein
MKTKYMIEKTPTIGALNLQVRVKTAFEIIAAEVKDRDTREQQRADGRCGNGAQAVGQVATTEYRSPDSPRQGKCTSTNDPHCTDLEPRSISDGIATTCPACSTQPKA